MQQHEENNSLVNQTISKLLDFESGPVTKVKENKSPELLDVLPADFPCFADTPENTEGQIQENWHQHENEALGKHIPSRKGQIFVVAAGVFLLLAVCVSIGNKLPLPLGFEAVKSTYGNVFYICMLVFAGFVLSLTTWLHWTKKLTRTANIVVIIAVVLSILLPILTVGPGSENNEIGGISRTLSGFPLTSKAPVYEPITGIIYSEDRPAAIIGSRIVHEGDTTHGIKIFKIHKDKVEFEANGKRWIQGL